MNLPVILFCTLICHVCGFNSDDDPSTSSTSSASLKRTFALIGLIWYIVILMMVICGVVEIYLSFNSWKYKPEEVHFDNQTNEIVDSDELEGVTIIRPIKGIDTELKICLESCLLQKYPLNKLQILFCVEDSRDPSIPIIQELIHKYPHIDAELLIDDVNNYEDNHFGPNPKINNLAKGYKLAKFDIIWVMDSNVWVNPGALIRSTISLKKSLDNQRKTSKSVKLIHHVPLALSIDDTATSPLNIGARLDEMFLFTSHAKFYTFFNFVSIAPCVNGKSNLYRRSELDDSVVQISQGKIWNTNDSITNGAMKFTQPGEGLRFFARYIGEDNMIGTALWEKYKGGRTGMTGDVVVQPISGNNGIKDYINRRVRWLRVRRYMVLFATLMEPTTESIVIGVFGSFGLSNLFFDGGNFWIILLIHEILWCLVDYSQYSILLHYSNKDLVEPNNENLPYFLNSNLDEKLNFLKWLPIWILREVLALPIWIIAMCGTEIDWRNRPFKIRSDLTAEEL